MRRRPWITKAELQEMNGRLLELCDVAHAKARNWEDAYGRLLRETQEREMVAREEMPTEHDLRERFRNVREREERLNARELRLNAKETALAQIRAFGKADNGVLKTAGMPRDPTTPEC